MTKKYPVNDNKPSVLFLRTLSGGGARSMSCGNCGREHFATYVSEGYGGGDEFDDEESWAYYKNEAEEALKECPEGVIIHEDDSFVECKDIGGISFVVDCPCNGLYKYEQFIWNNRNSIRDYIYERVKEEYELAQQELTRNKLAGITPEKKYSSIQWDPYV